MSVFVFFLYSFIEASKMAFKSEEVVVVEGVWDMAATAVRCGCGQGCTVGLLEVGGWELSGYAHTGTASARASWIGRI